jgi:hypothetical protein
VQFRLQCCTPYQILATSMRTSVRTGFDRRTSGTTSRHARQRTKDSQAELQSACIKSRSKPLEHIQSSSRECGRGGPTWVCTWATYIPGVRGLHLGVPSSMWSLSCSRNSSLFMEGSLASSQQPATGPYLEPSESGP